MNKDTDLYELAPSLEFMVRVKLPGKYQHHNSDYDNPNAAIIDAVFAVKPRGFEVKWPKPGQEWPVDSEGYTYVPLFLTAHKDALAHYMDSYFHLKKRNEDIRTAAEALGRLATIG